MGLLKDVVLPALNLRIAVRKNDSAKLKAPKLVGYVMITADQARTLLEACENNVDQVTFLRVAMWGARDAAAKYPLEGNVSLSNHNPEAELTQPAADEAKPERSIWW